MLTRVEFAPKSHVYSDATGPSRHLLPCAQAVRTSPRCRARGPGVREQGDRRPANATQGRFCAKNCHRVAGLPEHPREKMDRTVRLRGNRSEHIEDLGAGLPSD